MFLDYSSPIYKVAIYFLNYTVHNLITKEPYNQDTLTCVPLFIPLYVSVSIHNATRSAETQTLDLFNYPTIIILQQAPNYLHHACSYVPLSNSNINLGKEAVRVSSRYATVCF